MAAEDFVQEHVKAFNAHDAAAWASHYAENAVLHDPQYQEPKRGRDAVRQDIQEFFDGFPDIQFQILSVISSGDQAAIEGVGSGTQTGPIQGPGGPMPATNKKAQMPFASFVKFDSNGLIVEEHRYYDQVGMMMQLG